MDYIDTINGYAIYKFSKSACILNGYCYPTYGAFLNTESGIRPGYEECSMETFEELAEWCEKN